MKKIIGILGVAAIAMAMFFNTNIANSSSLNLEKLININVANAEGEDDCYEPKEEDCINQNTWEVVGHYTNCIDGSSSCTETDC